MKSPDPTQIAAKQVIPFGIYRRPMGQRSLRSWAGLSVVITFLAAVPCFAEDQNGAAVGQTASVSIDNSIYTPSEITVAPGTTVTWVNNDAMPHTVVDVNKSFRSKTLIKEGNFSFTFTNAGDYDYICSIHPNMKGKVIVKPKAG